MNPVHNNPPSYDEYTTGVSPSLLEVEDGLTQNQRRGQHGSMWTGLECFAEKLWAHLSALWLILFITFIISCVAMGKANDNARKIDDELSDSSSSPATHYNHWTSRCLRVQTMLYGDDVLEFNGHHYQIIGGDWARLTWHDSESDSWSRCYNGQPGYLASIETAAENAFLLEQLQKNPGYHLGDRAWIGGTDMQSEGVFTWLDGYLESTVFYRPGGNLDQYNNFAPGEPNENGSEDCVSFSGEVGDWNDDNCYRQFPYFIVEFDV